MPKSPHLAPLDVEEQLLWWRTRCGSLSNCLLSPCFLNLWLHCFFQIILLPSLELSTLFIYQIKNTPPYVDGGFEGSARLSSEITVWAETLSGGKAACIKMMSIMQNILMFCGGKSRRTCREPHVVTLWVGYAHNIVSVTPNTAFLFSTPLTWFIQAWLRFFLFFLFCDSDNKRWWQQGLWHVSPNHQRPHIVQM